jgi:hypothetical protein
MVISIDATYARGAAARPDIPNTEYPRMTWKTPLLLAVLLPAGLAWIQSRGGISTGLLKDAAFLVGVALLILTDNARARRRPRRPDRAGDHAPADRPRLADVSEVHPPPNAHQAGCPPLPRAPHPRAPTIEST